MPGTTRTNSLALLPLLALAGCQSGEPSIATTRDSAAVAWHDSVMAAMGGFDGWKNARYLHFRWNVIQNGQVVSDRIHDWDRRSGKYRLRTTTRDGDSLLALLNVNDRKGRVWVAGRPAEASQNDSLVERAYAMFINDSYWLLMPYKWEDPGVNLEYVGPKTDGTGAWEVVHLTFENVGLTPGDQYWAYISETAPHLMRKWQYHLQNQPEAGPMIRWENWQQFGPIKLATERNPIGAPFRIVFKEIEVSRGVSAGVFEEPGG